MPEVQGVDEMPQVVDWIVLLLVVVVMLISGEGIPASVVVLSGFLSEVAVQQWYPHSTVPYILFFLFILPHPFHVSPRMLKALVLFAAGVMIRKVRIWLFLDDFGGAITLSWR